MKSRPHHADKRTVGTALRERLGLASVGGISFGVASFPEHADGPDELVAAAHDALAQARALGDGRVVTHRAATERGVLA